MVGSYNYGLVALSVFISIIASYAALDLAGRVTSALGRTRLLWLTGGATAMGFGIWSMHYIGMLAFHLPIPVQYDWPTVLLSLLAAIFASAVALFVVSRRKMGLSQALVGSLFMGAGIAAMHYIGMAAMRLPAIPLLAGARDAVGGPRHRDFFRGVMVDLSLPGRYSGMGVDEGHQCIGDGGGHPCHALHGHGGRQFCTFFIRR